jgi:hypothetical protein
VESVEEAEAETEGGDEDEPAVSGVVAGEMDKI